MRHQERRRSDPGGNQTGRRAKQDEAGGEELAHFGLSQDVADAGRRFALEFEPRGVRARAGVQMVRERRRRQVAVAEEHVQFVVVAADRPGGL